MIKKTVRQRMKHAHRAQYSNNRRFYGLDKALLIAFTCAAENTSF